MPFSKPYTYVDGTVVSSTDQNSNDDAAKIYVRHSAR
jgi:hypothetical protein